MNVEASTVKYSHGRVMKSLIERSRARLSNVESSTVK